MWSLSFNKFCSAFVFLFSLVNFITQAQQEERVTNTTSVKAGLVGLSLSKEYAISMIQDLENDTIAINAQMKTGSIYINIADSLLQISPSNYGGAGSYCGKVKFVKGKRRSSLDMNSFFFVIGSSTHT